MQKIVTRWKQKDKEGGGGGLNETMYCHGPQSRGLKSLYSHWPTHAEVLSQTQEEYQVLVCSIADDRLQLSKRWVSECTAFFSFRMIHYITYRVNPMQQK